jgi:hypothetical protein
VTAAKNAAVFVAKYFSPGSHLHSRRLLHSRLGAGR